MAQALEACSASLRLHNCFFSGVLGFVLMVSVGEVAVHDELVPAGEPGGW